MKSSGISSGPRSVKIPSGRSPIFPHSRSASVGVPIYPILTEVAMSDMPPGLPKHPIGTFAFVGAYAVVFVLAWFAIYRFIFLARHPMTP